MSDQHAFVLAGLPGSGKSTAAEIIVDELQHNFEKATATEVSDFVRTYAESKGFDGDDNELGAWAAEIKRLQGDDYFVRKLAEQWSDASEHVAISGVRSPEEADAVRDVFGAEQTVVIAIWTLPDIRFERKYNDIPSVDHPQWETFQERNEREIHEWRCVEFFTDDGPSDYVVPNNSDFGALEAKLGHIIHHHVGAATRPDDLVDGPFPTGLDADRIAQYL